MIKELQDKAWAVLPKEFKKEVKIYYDEGVDWGHDVLVLEYLFGEHNITSYAKKDGTSAEPKYKVGDKVRISCVQDGLIWDNILHGRIATVKSSYLSPDDNSIRIYSFEEAIRDLAEAWLKPYTEPKSDHIERRLNIAKDFAAVLLGRLDYNPFRV